MKTINWKKVAKEYNLDPEEFTEQILRCASMVMELQMKNEKADKMTFKIGGFILTGEKK